ncbi:MAG: glycine dehydrogenase (aminomethyl-transferring), partial [Verrucomicrobiales bacterium]|nr:glycine dehydrogenase (aminomethyl-transferring) [Verrucomicrobiales bacterium]
MARTCGHPDLESLANAAVPAGIRLARPLHLPAPLSETEALARLKSIASKNRTCRSFIGMGYYDCLTPAVIQRNILENPGWYTQYTPYQSEISQGRLEGLLNYQTLVIDLTALPISNASLLDEATACAEAMTLCHRARGGDRDTFLVADHCHPQNLDLVQTRAAAIGLKVRTSDWRKFEFTPQVFGVLVQYPATHGSVEDLRALIEAAHAAGALVVMATDLLALTLLPPPGELGADVAVGSAQRFGVPLGFGGPHAAFIATRDEFKRSMPGRLVGVSKDARGRPALRLSLGTREQHIRREKATSNICTAQALLANMAMAYACYHGPEGLTAIAQGVHALTARLAAGIARLGLTVINPTFFDTLTVQVADAAETHRIALAHHINLRRVDARHVGISLDEATTESDVALLLRILNA